MSTPIVLRVKELHETTLKSILYGELGQIQDGRRQKSFYAKITMSMILKTKLYLLSLYKNKKIYGNEVILLLVMVIKDSFISLIMYIMQLLTRNTY